MLDLLVEPADRQTGSAFCTSDLLLLRGWSEFHALTMSIDLRHETAGIPCDEAIRLTASDGSGAWLLWREQAGIALRPEGRSARCFARVADALQAVRPAPADKLSDIQPTAW